MAAISQVLDRQRIEAQWYRSCQNILKLATGDTSNKLLLERACQELLAQATRLISSTSVKQHIVALSAQAASRPTTTAQQRSQRLGTTLRQFGPRDTSGAHLAGPERFSLNELLQHGNTMQAPQQDEGR